LLPRNIHGEFTDDLSKLFLVFVFLHLVFTYENGELLLKKTDGNAGHFCV
jgi:hypothetical protein